MREKIILITLSLFCFSNLCISQDEAELVKKVKQKLDQVNNYVAEGKMKLDVSFINAPVSKVSIYYKKPDKFKVKKNGGISILPKGGVSINLASLLSNSDYDLVPGKDAIVNGKNTRVVKLLPGENSDVVLTTLYIDEKNLVILQASVTTKENGTYAVWLDYGKYISWGLPDKVIFSFNTKDYKLPKGITFEYEKGGKTKEGNIKNKKGSVEINYTNYVINKGVDDKIFQSGD